MFNFGLLIGVMQGLELSRGRINLEKTGGPKRAKEKVCSCPKTKKILKQKESSENFSDNCSTAVFFTLHSSAITLKPLYAKV